MKKGQALIADPAEGDRYLRHYYGCIETVDQAVGRVMKAVEQSAKEWVVIFTSDHGFHVLDKERMSKYTLWPMSTQVPLILKGGPFVGGVMVDTPVSLADLYPTIEGLVGFPRSHELSGIDLLTTVDGSSTRQAIVVYYTASSVGGDYKAVVTQEWHFIEYPDKTVELYDRVADPWVITNVAAEYPAVVEELRAVEML